MFRPSWKFLLVGAVVVASLTAVTSSADAWWGCRGWGCGYGGYSIGCDPCGYGGYGWYVGVRPGPIRRAVFGPYRWYWGGYGGYPYYGYGCYPYYGYGCYSDCGWSTVSYGCCGDVVVGGVTTQTMPAQPNGKNPTPAEKQPGETTPADPTGIESKKPTGTELPGPGFKIEPGVPGLGPGAPGDSSFMPTQANSGQLTVWVPYDAKVIINGLETRSTGSKRQFVSFGLKPGFNYKYEVRARVIRDGVAVEETKVVTLTAGERDSVAFGFNPQPKEELAATP